MSQTEALKERKRIKGSYTQIIAYNTQRQSKYVFVRCRKKHSLLLLSLNLTQKRKKI